MIKHQLFIGAALIVGVAIGFFAAPTTTVVQPADETYVPSGAIANEGESASIAALRARIAELEAQLKGDQTAGAEIVSNAVARIEGRRERRGKPREWMEELKKNDPERYHEMTNRFAQWRQAHRERQQSKLDFLGSIDTSHMSAGAKATHEKLQDLIIRRDEIENELQSLGMSDDEDARREIFGRLMDVNREIAELNGEERKNLLNETAKILGLGDAEADALTETVQDILEVTENNFGGPGGPRGGRGPRGR